MITIKITHTVSGEGASTASQIIAMALRAAGRNVKQVYPVSTYTIDELPKLSEKSILIIEEDIR